MVSSSIATASSTATGYKGLFGHSSFDGLTTGRFTAPRDGIYLAAANIRLDHADQGWFSAAVLTNGESSFESGMSVLNGDLVNRPAISYESADFRSPGDVLASAISVDSCRLMGDRGAFQADNHDDMCLIGLRRLAAADYLSVWSVLRTLHSLVANQAAAWCMAWS